jgi:hypothetical protein
MTGDSYKIIEGISQVGFHKSSNALIQDCFVYYKDNQTVYSSAGLISAKTLSEYYYGYDKIKEEIFISTLNTLKSPKEGFKKRKACYFSANSQTIKVKPKSTLPT